MKTTLIFVVFCVLVACTNQITKAEAPKDVLSRTEMVALTKDLLLLESHVELTYGQVGRFYKILNASSEHLFEKHKISKDRYIRSFDYFASDQDKMTEIYQEVLDSLNIEKFQ